jgi:hypothetical protein
MTARTGTRPGRLVGEPQTIAEAAEEWYSLRWDGFERDFVIEGDVLRIRAAG